MRYYGKIHSKLTIFCVKSVKIYTGQKKLHEYICGVRDKYQVWLKPCFLSIFPQLLYVEIKPNKSCSHICFPKKLTIFSDSQLKKQKIQIHKLQFWIFNHFLGRHLLDIHGQNRLADKHGFQQERSNQSTLTSHLVT